MENLKLNYKTLSTIMGIKQAEAKEIIADHFGEEKAKIDMIVSVSEIKNKFGKIVSIDTRYDGENELLFNLRMRKESYRKRLDKPSNYKFCRFRGGDEVYYFILSSEQIEHAHKAMEYRFKYMFGVKLLNDTLIKRAEYFKENNIIF